MNFYLGIGARNDRIRQLYIRTFIAYDLEAMQEYDGLVDRFIKRAKAQRAAPEPA